MASNVSKGGGKAVASKLTERNIKVKIVASDVCKKCKDQCPRGIEYLNKMSNPGAEGRGVPCSKAK